MYRASDRALLRLAFGLLAGALLLSPLDRPLHTYLNSSWEGTEPPLQLLLGWLTVLWPLVVAAAVAFSARRLWRAGGLSRRAGLAALGLALGIAIFTVVRLYADFGKLLQALQTMG